MKFNYLVALIYAFLLMLVTYLAYGIFFGWIDDVLMMNAMRGIFSNQPFSDFFLYHRVLSKAYVALYQSWPGVPWYGLAMGMYLLLALANLFYFLVHIFSEFVDRKYSLFLYFGIFYFLFCLENVYLITFTRVAILLMGSSLFCIYQIVKKERWKSIDYWGIVAFSIMFAIGYLTRMEMALVVLATFFLFLFFLPGFSKRKMLGLFLGLGLVVGTHQALEKAFLTSEKKAFLEIWGYIQNSLDGANFNPELDALQSNPADSIRLKAVESWFFLDEQQITPDFLARITAPSPFSWNTLRHWRQNLYQEYQKARFRFTDYNQYLNWWPKVLLYFFLHVYLISLVLLSTASKKLKWGFGLYLFAGWGMILALTILLKMEDRLFSPWALIFTVGALVYCSQLTRPQTKALVNFCALVFLWLKSGMLKQVLKTLGLIILLVIIGIRGIAYHNISKEKAIELDQKARIVKEINNKFFGEILFFDIWSMTLIHSTPFQNIDLNPNNQYLTYGEYFSNSYDAHKAYLTKLFGSDRFIDVCEYGQRHPEEVIFLFGEYRATMLEDYLRILYGKPYHFKSNYPDTELSKIRHSFSWFPVQYNYYTLTTTQ